MTDQEKEIYLKAFQSMANQVQHMAKVDRDFMEQMAGVGKYFEAARIQGRIEGYDKVLETIQFITGLKPEPPKEGPPNGEDDNPEG